MKILQKVLSSIPDKEYTKYSIDIKVLLKYLANYEVDVPDEFFLNNGKEYKIGAAFDYLNSIPNGKIVEQGNSYNWGSNISNDFYYSITSFENKSYVALQINLYGDVRCHSCESTSNNSYSDIILLEFREPKDFIDALNEIVAHHCSFIKMIDKDTYLITPNLKSDGLKVYSITKNIIIDDICASDDQEFEKEIKQKTKQFRA